MVYSITGFCIVATLIPLIPSNKWWIRGFDFPHAQISFLTFATGLVLLVLLPFTTQNFVVLGCLIVCFFYQFSIIYPYTPFAKKQVLTSHDQRNSIKLLSCNVYQNNRQANRCLSLIEHYDPDLVLMVETDRWWYEQTSQLKHRYPYLVDCPLDNTYGMLLYSKMPLVDPKVLFLVEEQVPSIHTTVAMGSERFIKLHCLHPAPPSPSENDTATERDAELLIVAKELDPVKFPTIVMGDLNDVAWSSSTKLFQKVSGLLDPRIGRGFFNTFHVSFPLLRWPLDHFFHSNHFKVVKIKRAPNIGSDHFPIYIHLSYDPLAASQQDSPKSRPEEEELANEKIDEALES